MNVTKYIKKLCESRNVQYEDITHTFYYKAFFDLLEKGYLEKGYNGNVLVDEGQIISHAKNSSKI